MKKAVFLTFFLMLVIVFSGCGRRAAEPVELIQAVERPVFQPVFTEERLQYDQMYEDFGVFPSLHIYSELDPFDIDRELWHDGHIGNLSVRLRGRGNSTWWNGPDKRPLRFRFEQPMSVLGSENIARDWILLANHFDKSLLRNYAALNFAGMLGGMDFVPSATNLHLYVNGEYMGVYLLTDERDVGPGRMELEWNEDPSLSGFFLELDARAPDGGTEDEDFVMVNGMAFDLRWPGSSLMTPEHVEYVKDYLEAVSLAVRSQNFEEIVELIDITTFVDFYLVQEFFKNADVHSLSVFMHIKGEGDERRLFMGPVWDFDIAAGNLREQMLGEGPENLYAAIVNYWYRNLMNTPEFFDAVVTRWNEIRDEAVAQTIALVQETAIRYQAEFERNFERHPIMGVEKWSTPDEILMIEDFMSHVDYLINWMQGRADWLDDAFNGRIPDFDPLWALVLFHTYERPIDIIIDGRYQDFDIPPIMLQDTIMISLDDNIFNITVDYNAETGMVAMEVGSVSIIHAVNSPIYIIDGERLIFHVSSVVIRDRVFIPLRIITDALGYELEWDTDAHVLSTFTEAG